MLSYSGQQGRVLAPSDPARQRLTSPNSATRIRPTQRHPEGTSFKLLGGGE